jgi:hypothetical protein
MEGQFNEVTWWRSDEFPHCPIVIHLTSEDFDEIRFTSADLMKPLAQKTDVWVDGSFHLELQREGLRLSVGYARDGSLKSVGILVPPTTASRYRISVLGQNLLLPIGKEDLFNALGEPLKFREAFPP